MPSNSCYQPDKDQTGLRSPRLKQQSRAEDLYIYFNLKFTHGNDGEFQQLVPQKDESGLGFVRDG